MASTQRLYWIDWMKVIGMYCIVTGHLFPIGSDYFYAFSVPLFFMISGFLYRCDASAEVFFKKIFYNLVLPMLLLGVFDILRLFFTHALHTAVWHTEFLWYKPLAFLMGFHEGLKALWFVYTLVLLKIMQRYLARNLWGTLGIMGLLLGLGYLGNHYRSSHGDVCSFLSSSTPNAIYACTLCYFYFGTGYILQKCKGYLNQPLSLWLQAVILPTGLLLIYFCVQQNGFIRYYANDYGPSLFPAIAGAYGGTAVVYLMSRWLERFHPRWMIDISMGTLLILGLHLVVVVKYIHYVNHHIFLDYMAGMLITLGFVPVIRLARRYAPVLLGIYRVKSNTTSNTSNLK